MGHVFHAAEIASASLTLATTLTSKDFPMATSPPAPGHTLHESADESVAPASVSGQQRLPMWEQVMLHADGRELWFEHQLSFEQIGAEVSCSCAVLVSRVRSSARFPFLLRQHPRPFLVVPPLCLAVRSLLDSEQETAYFSHMTGHLRPAGAASTRPCQRRARDAAGGAATAQRSAGGHCRRGA